MVNESTSTGQSEQLDGLKTGALSPWLAGGLALAAFVPGVGVATIPPLLTAYAGPWGWVGAITAAIVVLCVAISVVVFARRFVVSGALYSYVHKIFGGVPSVITAASMLFAYVCGIALLVLAACMYGGTFLFSLGVTWALDPITMIVIAIVVSVLGAVTAYFGVDISAKLSVILLIVSLPLSLIVTVMLPFAVPLDFSQSFDFSAVPFDGTAFLAAATLAVAVMILFESATATAVETRNPKRALPVIVLGIPIVLGLLYAGATIIQLPALGLVAGDLEAGVPATVALANLVGVGWAGSLTDLALAIASISAVIAFVNYGSRVAATMAQDGVLPARLTKVHARFGTPTAAIIFVSVLVLVASVAMLALVGGDIYAAYGFNAAIYALFVVVPYILISIGAVVVLIRERAKTWIPVAVTSIVGVVGFAWTFIGAVTAPAEGALALIPWIYLAVMVIVSVVMLVIRAGSRTRVGAPVG